MHRRLKATSMGCHRDQQAGSGGLVGIQDRRDEMLFRFP